MGRSTFFSLMGDIETSLPLRDILKRFFFKFDIILLMEAKNK